MDGSLQIGPVSPVEASPIEPQQHDGRHQPFHPRPNRWSGSTEGTPVEMTENARWERPPIPPIPVTREKDAWRRRSLKRCSYTSQMSNYSMTQPLAVDAEMKFHAEHMSITSISPSMKSMALSQKTARETRRRRDKRTNDELHWQVATYNPRNWSRTKKWFHTSAAAGVAFVCLFASSIVAPAHVVFETDFGVSSILAVLPLSLYVLGLAFGPTLSIPCSQLFGRKSVYMISMPIFALLTMASALVQSFYGFVVCRFLAGTFASPGLFVGTSTIMDAWPINDRSLPLAFHCTSSLLGLTLAPLIGACVVKAENWRWTQYVILFAFAACAVPVVTIRETCKNTILQRRRIESNRKATAGATVRTTFARPLRMLVTEPIVLMGSLCISLVLALLFAAFTAFPMVFQQVYAFDLQQQGVTLVGMVVGVVVGLLILSMHNALIHQPRVAKYQEERAIEAENAMAVKGRMKSGSRGSQGTWTLDMRKSEISLTSRPMSRLSRDPSRTSLIQKVTTKGTETPPQDPGKNAGLAVAAASYLNNVPENRGKRIMPERIVLLLNKNLTFNDLCTQLEVLELKVDTVGLAKALADAHDVEPSVESGDGASELAPLGSLYRSATTLVLATPTPSPPIQMSPMLSTPSLLNLDALQPFDPPTEWRLYIALPGTVLISGSLFMFGWTAELNFSSVIPIVAMGIFSCGAMLVIVPMTEYMIACSGSRYGESAMAGSTMLRYVLSAAFPLFVLPMYRALGSAWATSVLGLISVGLGAVLWLLVLVGPTLRRKQRCRSRS